MSNKSSLNISDSITKFIEIKTKLTELEKRYEKYRKIVENHMNDNELSKITHTIGDDTYSIKKTSMSRQSVCKKDLPADIWNKYCKTSMYNVINVNKIK